MLANLLCPGPSLAKWHAKDLLIADYVIGVNRAAKYVRCDWWVAGDACTVKFQNPGYGVQLFTAPEVLGKATDPKLSVWSFLIADDFCQLKEYCWNEYSACAGLVLAGHLGAKRIHVYGADWTDEADYDGYKSPDYNRNQNRWERERQFWERITAFLLSRGIEVAKH